MEKFSLESRLQKCESDYKQHLSIANDQVESLQKELQRYKLELYSFIIRLSLIFILRRQIICLSQVRLLVHRSRCVNADSSSSLIILPVPVLSDPLKKLAQVRPRVMRLLHKTAIDNALSIQCRCEEMMTDNLRSLTGKYQDLEDSYSEC